LKQEHDVSNAALTVTDQPTKAPRSHVGPISTGDKRRATVLRKVRPGGIVTGHDWQPDPAHRHHGVCKAVREAVAQGHFELVLVDELTIQWAVRFPA
jgi:hypothetical protein